MTTLLSSSRAGIVARVVLSLCISIAIAEPLLATLFHGTVTARIESQLVIERTVEENRYDGLLAADDAQIAQLRAQVTKDQVRLEQYAPENIAMSHYMAAAADRDKAMGVVRQQRNLR